MARYIACMGLISAPGVLAQMPSGCDMAQALPITMACANNIDPTDATFCTSQCYRVLAPFVTSCRAAMPSYVQMMLATPLSLLTQCQAPPAPPPTNLPPGSAPAPQNCNIMSLFRVCSAHPPPN